MSLGHVAIIGFGAIAQDLIEILKTAEGGPPKHLTILARPGRELQISQALSDPRIAVTSRIEAVLESSPDVVVECAGHAAVGAYGATVLNRGVDLIVASVGAFADPQLGIALLAAAQESGAQCVVPAGAIGGIDALGAARLSGLNEVIYTGRKPPQAWGGTPAERVVDLAALSAPHVFFNGSAREAAQQYPKNANVAATLALAGLGMDQTRVRLIADPEATENVHEFSVTSQALEFSMRLVGKPSVKNPKTSRSTVYSIARAVLNRSAAIVI